MFTNLFLGFFVMILCLMLQIIILVFAIRYYLKHQYKPESASLLTSLLVITGIMSLLLIGNLGQVAVWALLFIMLDEFQLFSNAFYHSAVNFSSLGYGDIVMTQEHRLLGALEAINGILMIGISTAALSSPFKDAIRSTRIWQETDKKSKTEI